MTDTTAADPIGSGRLTTTALLWSARLAWVVVGVAGWTAIDDLDVDGAPGATLSATAAVWWLLGVAGLAFPSVVALTLARVTVPAAVPALGVIAAIGDDVSTSAIAGAVTAAVVASVTVARTELGRRYVQASAYGREDRHLLRAPPSFLLAAVVAWVIVVAAGIGATVAFAQGTWWLGAVLAVPTIGVGAFAWPRWHRLSRRWLVLLPSGVVVHDHLVLAETLMVPRRDVAALRLAPADTEAADLTGPAGGHALELLTRVPVTAIRAATPSRPRGTAIHLQACLVAPSRPGRALAAAGAYRLPVG